MRYLSKPSPQVSGPAAENIRRVAEVEDAVARAARRSERISHAIARFVGSIPFVLAHAVGFASGRG